MKLKDIRGMFAHRRTVVPAPERTYIHGNCPECHHPIDDHIHDNCGLCDKCDCVWMELQNRCHHDEVIDNACTRCLVFTRILPMYQDEKNVAHWVKTANHFESGTNYFVRACDRKAVDPFTVSLPIQKIDCDACSKLAYEAIRKG